MKYALIDMGSNSIRLTVYDLDKNASSSCSRKRSWQRCQVSQVTVSHYGVREGYLRRRIQSAL